MTSYDINRDGTADLALSLDLDERLTAALDGDHSSSITKQIEEAVNAQLADSGWDGDWSAAAIVAAVLDRYERADATVTELTSVLDADHIGDSIDVYADMAEGADAIRDRGTNDHAQLVHVGARDDDVIVWQVDAWLSKDKDCEDDEESKVFALDYQALAEGLDAALIARGLPVTDTDGGYRVISKNVTWAAPK